jgi:adenylate kinase
VGTERSSFHVDSRPGGKGSCHVFEAASERHSNDTYTNAYSFGSIGLTEDQEELVLRPHEVLLLLGPPGAGKGTQARYLARRLGIPHVASGDLLRGHVKRGTTLGREAARYMEQGELVPDDLVVDMIMDRLSQPDADGGALLDGFPRTAAQAEALERRLQQHSGGVRAAFYVEVPTEVLVERLGGRLMCSDCQASHHERFAPPTRAGICDTCGGTLYQRSDDTREVVGHRVEVFVRDTMPVVRYYDVRSKLVRLDGNRPIQSVCGALLAAVGLAS